MFAVSADMRPSARACAAATCAEAMSDDVDEVPDAGAVRRGVVVTEDQRREPADQPLEHHGDEVRVAAVGELRRGAAGDVEVAEAGVPQAGGRRDVGDHPLADQLRRGRRGSPAGSRCPPSPGRRRGPRRRRRSRRRRRRPPRPPSPPPAGGAAPRRSARSSGGAAGPTPRPASSPPGGRCRRRRARGSSARPARRRGCCPTTSGTPAIRSASPVVRSSRTTTDSPAVRMASTTCAPM